MSAHPRPPGVASGPVGVWVGRAPARCAASSTSSSQARRCAGEADCVDASWASRWPSHVTTRHGFGVESSVRLSVIARSRGAVESARAVRCRRDPAGGAIRFMVIRSSRLATGTVVDSSVMTCARDHRLSKSIGYCTNRSTARIGLARSTNENTCIPLSRTQRSRIFGSANPAASTGARGTNPRPTSASTSLPAGSGARSTTRSTSAVSLA